MVMYCSETNKFDCVQLKLSSALRSLGQHVGQYPFHYIGTVFLLTTALSTGVFRINYTQDLDYLFTSENDKAIQNKNTVEELFKINTSVFTDLSRMTQRKYITMFIIVPKDGANIFRHQIFKELKYIDSIVKNISIEWNGQFHNYSTLCGKKNDKCYENPIFNLERHINDINTDRYKIKYPYDMNPITFVVTTYIENFGGVDTDDKGVVTEVKAARLIYVLDFSNETKHEAMRRWELALSREINNMKLQNVNVTFMTWYNIASEVKELTRTLLPKTFIVGIIIILFSTITFMTNDWIKSKPWLGVAGCVSAASAVIAAFGFLFHCGVPYSDVNVAIPFLILATEIDDAFVLVASWRRTNPKDSAKKRMGEAYYEAAVSITITSVTNIVSFCIGIFIPFPAVRIFCIYSAVSILFTYVYQITLFGGCMAIDGYRENRGINPFTFRISKWKSMKIEKNTDDITKSFFANIISFYLNLFPVKMLVIIISVCNLSLAIKGLFFIKQGMKPTDVFRPDSETASYSNMHYKYFSKFPYPVHIVVRDTLNYADPKVQRSIEEMLKTFEDHPYIADNSLTLSWLKYYKVFSSNGIAKYLMGNYNISDKQDFIDGLRNVFLRISQAKEFAADLKFNENYTEIISSRFLVTCKDIENTEIEVELVKDLQRLAEESNLPIIVHNVLFPVFEQAFIIREIALQVVLASVISILIIFFIFVPNILCSLCVSVIILIVLCETIGFMALWDVRLDMISMIVLIMTVGFSINYPTHIAFAYVTGEGNSQQRLKTSLGHVGWPVFQGTLSTILGISILAFQEVRVFVVFFKIVFLAAVHVGFNSMFLLPVVLSVAKRN